MMDSNSLSEHSQNNRYNKTPLTMTHKAVLPSRGNLKRQRSPSPSSIQVTLHGKARHVQENGPSAVSLVNYFLRFWLFRD